MKIHIQSNLAINPPSSTRPSHLPTIAGMFGLGDDPSQTLALIPPTTLNLLPSQIIFITGPSGGGKSTLLRLIAEAANTQHAHILNFNDISIPGDQPVIDCFGQTDLKQVLYYLSLAGLNDAFVMLRTPAQLSDGQRMRFRLAQVMWQAVEWNHDTPVLVLADEFAATLDRQTASIVARNVRKWVTRSPICFIAATTHDDLLESLDPDVLIEKGLADEIEILHKPASARATFA